MEHVFYRQTNPHLSNAIVKYGLAAFTFSVLEFVSTKQALLERELFYLDLLFSLPADK